jgi:hypothetical protein
VSADAPLGTAGSDPAPLVPMRRALLVEIDSALRVAAAECEDEARTDWFDSIGQQVSEALRR